MSDEMAVAVSLDMKVNLGNYESASVFVSVSGVTPGSTEEEIEAALDTGALAYKVLRRQIATKINDVRSAGGW